MRIPASALALLALLAGPAALADDGAEDIGKEKAAKPPEGGTVGAVRDPAAVEREVRELRADINVLNLVNGIHLTPHQILHVLRAAREAAEVVEEATPPARDPKVLRKEAEALERIRDAMVAGEEAPADALRDLGNLRTRVRIPRRPASAAAKRLRELEERVEAEFLPAQKEVIRTYKACLVPPQELRDPVRVGQASDAGPMRRVLDRVVAMPAGRWERERERFTADLVDEEQEHFGRLDEEELAARKAALRAGFEAARGMDAATLALRKDALAEELRAVDRVHELHMEIESLSGDCGQPGKVARILLDPRVIPILERRLRRLREEARSPVDLDAVKEADRCRDGHCAVRREGP